MQDMLTSSDKIKESSRPVRDERTRGTTLIGIINMPAQ